MEKMKLPEIERAVNGRINNEAHRELAVTSVGTDSRADLTGGLFVPIRGERFDGHNYINEAYAKGAVCALSERDIESDKPVILVEDTKKALRDLAEYYRSLFDVKIVAVTGSAGKTTTKDLIHAVLSAKFRTLKNQGNLNNEIGLPLTIFSLDRNHEAAVLEMGMSGFGEIHNLAKIARPDIALITNIGQAHIEMLGSREGIFRAKCEIFDFLPERNGRIVANGDDSLLATLKNEYPDVTLYGNHAGFDVYATNITCEGLSGVRFDVNTHLYGYYNVFPVKVCSPGAHTVSNALAAASVGTLMGLSYEEITEGLSHAKLSAMRMDIFTANNITVINDSYNSNPDSARAAIDVLSAAELRTVCVLGDMLELGSFSEQLHRDVGMYAASKKIDLIICIGNYAKAIYDGASEVIASQDAPSQLAYFTDKDSFLLSIHSLISPLDTVLVKASRSMGFEEIVRVLR